MQRVQTRENTIFAGLQLLSLRQNAFLKPPVISGT
jgi:hypothetical protein